MSDTPKPEPTPAAPPPLTEEQARKLMVTGQLFHTLAADPKYRNDVLSLIKRAAPDTYIPELEVTGEIDRRLAERDKKQDEDTAALKKQVEEMSQRLARQDWAAKSGLTEDELVEVETLAKEYGITKGETAVEHWRMKNQLGTPRPTPAVKESEEYMTKLRKVKPTDGVRLKQLAIEEGTRLLRQMRGTRRAS